MRAPGEQKRVGATYVARGYRMTPGEIRACHRLYAAHRKSREICTFAGTNPAMSNAGHPGDLAVPLRLHTGLEELARDIGRGDPNNDLRPALVGHGGLRKILASFAAQLLGRGVLVGH
jgi:hypothetical protein